MDDQNAQTELEEDLTLDDLSLDDFGDAGDPAIPMVDDADATLAEDDFGSGSFGSDDFGDFGDLPDVGETDSSFADETEAGSADDFQADFDAPQDDSFADLDFSDTGEDAPDQAPDQAPEQEDVQEESAGDLEDIPLPPILEDEDDEPIALSEDELDNILGADAETIEAEGEQYDPEEELSVPEGLPIEDMDSPAEEDSLDTGDDFGSDEISFDDSFDLPEDLQPEESQVVDVEEEQDSDTVDESPVAEEASVESQEEDPMSGIAADLDQDDDEPVSLSEDELDNILGDVDEEHTAVSEEAPAGFDEEFPVFDDELTTPENSIEFGSDEDQPGAGTDAVIPDDDVGLSDQELSEAILYDETAEASVDTEDDFEMPSLADLDSDDEDESISLTPEELGNIVSDEELLGEEAQPVSEEAPDEPLQAESEEDIPSVFDEDDDGPIALSANELDNILEDVTEEEAVETERPDIEPIVLDDHDEEPVQDAAVAAMAEDRQEQIEAVAGDVKVNPAELKKVISYLDNLFDRLPEDTIREFSRSEYFDLYKKVMEDLGL